MRTIVRSVLVQSLALFLTSQILSGLLIVGGLGTYLIGGVLMGILSFALKPLLNIIAFPLNILTFGLFTWVINAVLLWILTVLVSKINIYPFSIHQVSFVGLTIPTIHVSGIIPAYIVVAAVLSATTWAITWLIKT